MKELTLAFTPLFILSSFLQGCSERSLSQRAEENLSMTKEQSVGASSALSSHLKPGDQNAASGSSLPPLV